MMLTGHSIEICVICSKVRCKKCGTQSKKIENWCVKCEQNPFQSRKVNVLLNQLRREGNSATVFQLYQFWLYTRSNHDPEEMYMYSNDGFAYLKLKARRLFELTLNYHLVDSK